MRPSTLIGARLAHAQDRRFRRRLALAFGALWTTAAVHGVLTLSGLAASSDAMVRAADLLYSAVGVLAAVLVVLRARHVEAERAAWGWLAASMILFAGGNVLWSALYVGLDEAPYPSWADAAWTLYYLPTYVGLALLIRARLRHVPRAVVLDGLVSALGLAALVAGLMLGPILAATRGAPLTVLVNVTYPVGDVMLLALCAAALALTRGRPGPPWIILVAGLAANAVADTTFLFQAAKGTFLDGGPLDVLWVLGMASLGLAAWQTPPPAVEHAGGMGEHAIPAVFSSAAVALLAYGAFASAMPRVAVALAVATVVITAVRVALVIRDVQRLSESRRLAESDELTGLLNRRGLLRHVDAALVRARDDAGLLSLLLLDLNRFKEVNDTLGHHAGDHLLEEVARRLEACLPDATIGRLGGDEFVVLLECGPHEAEAAARRVRLALGRPLILDGLATHAQASIGIACSPQHGGRRGDLLRHADVAMYRAKHRDSGVELYAAEGDRNSRERLALAAELRAALSDPSQIQLHYQPQVDLDSGRVASVEALVRWQHPEHGLLTPDRFLEIAEQHALMHDLTLAVIDRALRQQRAWRRTELELTVAVNVTAADLLDGAFPDQVAARLQACDTPPGGLMLELTESTVMGEPERALATLARLSELGVALSLDDFGTGYSSLAHLKRLPVQELKVDRSFVMDMLTDRDDAIIVRSTVELGRSLGLRVVAEGVETLEHLEQLRYFGCHLAQGFLFSRALPAVNLAAWLRDHHAGTPIALQPAAGSTALRPATPAGMLGTLVDLAAIVADGGRPAEAIAALGRKLHAYVSHDDLVVYGLDPGDGTLSALYAEGRWMSETCSERFPGDQGVTGAALREGRMRNVSRTDLDPDAVRIDGTEDEVEALVCCPLVANGRRLGVLNLYRSRSVAPFSDEEAAVVERFAGVAALALRQQVPVPSPRPA